MAIYHCSIKPIVRGGGRGAVSSAAYRSGSKLRDQAKGEVHDFSRKGGVRTSEIVLPDSIAHREELAWARDREMLWNRAEAAERRAKARVAREYELGLPHELSAQQQLTLVRGFSQALADRYRVAVDFSIHEATRQGDDRNQHAHVMTTTRELAPASTTGFGRKADIELSNEERAGKGLPPASQEFAELRALWAERVNDHLKQHGLGARVDSRSLKNQGIGREPTRHKGPYVTAIERRRTREAGRNRDREQDVRPKKVRDSVAAKKRQPVAVRERPRPMTEAERDAAVEARWLARHEERQRKAREGSESSIEERYLTRREERLRDPEGQRRREREKELERARARDRSRGRGG